MSQFYKRMAALRSEIRGYEQGTNERADLLVESADGANLNQIWDEIQATLALWNRQRDTLISQFTFGVSTEIDVVSVPSEVDFEEASEYGQPKGIKGFASFNRGYDFKFYDLAVRFTWMYLAGATAAQIRNLHNQALEADNRLLYNKVLKMLFNPSNLMGVADQNIPMTVYKFYNGDGEVPPKYKNNTFLGTHTHYSTTQTLAASATFTSETFDAVETDLIQHGYTPGSGTKFIVLMNRQEGAIARSFRVASGDKYDFIPSSNYGGGVIMAANSGIIARPQGEVQGQFGTYGPFHLVEEDFTPAGYLVHLFSGGPDNLTNPIGIREHKNASYRGLLHIPGARSDYPLTDSFYRRGIGAGIRQRGAGFIVQVTASATYTVPAAFA